MDIVVTDRLHEKQGRSIVRWTLEQKGQSLVVYLKRHYELPRRLGLLATLFPSQTWTPGLEEWEHLQWARQIGLPVPRPLAAGEFVLPSGRVHSFLAVEELTDMLPLHQTVPIASKKLDLTQFHQWKLGLCREMARLTQMLHSRSLFHRDLYFCHFYIPERLTTIVPEQWQNQVWMIDFHRLTSGGMQSWWYAVKDLAQLLYSSEVDGVTDRDRHRFWLMFRGRGGLLARLTRWAVRMKYRRYRAHNRKGD